MRPGREREADPGRASWLRQVLNVPSLERATQALALLFAGSAGVIGSRLATRRYSGRRSETLVIANGFTVAPASMFDAGVAWRRTR